MSRQGSGTARGEHLGPTNPRLLGNPIDFIAEDHMRERAICAMIDKIAAAEQPDRDDCDHVLAFLREELPLHLADEDEDLFPMMRARCEPDDEIDIIIDRLQSDHGHALTDTPDVVALLRRGSELPDDGRARLTDFATHSRRHIIVENAIILPIARARLSKDDLDIMRLHMLKRRGLDRLLGA
jgi:hemerythrin-like domain-containing protein